MQDYATDTDEETPEVGEDAINDLFGGKLLRWYQVAVRNALVEVLRRRKNARALIELPTGAGKTICIAASLADQRVADALSVHGRKLRVLFLAHKHRLLTQAERTFLNIDAVEVRMHSIFQDLPTDFEWDISVIDECHHEGCSTIQHHLETIGDRAIIGLTATKDRADGLLIKFDEIIAPISRDEAVAQGYLAPTSIHSFVDVPSKDKINILTDIMENFGHQMGQSMMFVRTKHEVRAMTAVIQSLGYTAVGVLDQSNKELDSILNSFSKGDIQFIVNCNKINEGVDVVGCDTVVLGRTFGSYPQLNQVIGRAARPDSHCNVWELINPLSGRNLDCTVIVGTPESHRLVAKEGGRWVERQFDYTSHQHH